MKKIFLFLGMLMPAVLSLQAVNVSKEIRLNNYGKGEETVVITDLNHQEVCRLVARLGEVDDDGNYSIDVSIENMDGSYVMYLFGDFFTRKQLRKLRPLVVYDKGFKELRTARCAPLVKEHRSYVRILPGRVDHISIDGTEEEGNYICKLPLYYAKEVGYLFKRHALLDVQTMDLNIFVDIRPSASYMDLQASIDGLMNRVSNAKFVVCKHRSGKRHHPDLQEQKNAIRRVTDSLLNQVSAKMDEVRPGSKRYMEYRELRKQLEDIDVEKIPVENCTIPDAGCSCSPRIAAMGLEQIYKRMEDLYLMIYNGEKSKNEVIAEVRALKAHSAHVRHDPKNSRSGIDRYYDRIINM